MGRGARRQGGKETRMTMAWFRQLTTANSQCLISAKLVKVYSSIVPRF